MFAMARAGVVEVTSLNFYEMVTVYLPHIAAADYIYKDDGVYNLKRETK